MKKSIAVSLAVAAPLLGTTAVLYGTSSSSATNPVNVENMPLVRTIDERYMSFQVGMSHLTGGETWKTYDGSKEEGGAKQADNFEAIREVRLPTDLTNSRLRTLTEALSPLYIRYGGTTTNSVYFQDNDEPRLDQVPDGYRWILTRDSWKGALEFADAVDAKVLTGFTVSDGVRDEAHAWTPEHAAPFVAFTDSIGGEIYAAELYNEPNAREPGRTEEGESAEDFARDFALFDAFMSDASPSTKLGAPGVAALGIPVPIPSLEKVTPEQYMSAEPLPKPDLITYHFYGAVAERCVPPGAPAGVTAEQALTEEWLARPDKTFQRYKALRDNFAPDAPIWLTETGTASCGGTRWQPTFLETFRFLDTHARLAKQGLDAIFTHALISGSNGVIDEKTFMPNADYWAALLWRKLMGTKVLDAGDNQPGLHTYAHCQRGHSGGVTVLAINLQDKTETVSVSGPAELYTLTAPELQSRVVQLNGKALELGEGGTLPVIKPEPVDGDNITLAPTSISFITVPEANNTACNNPH
ncbi:hypothetical protein [Pseudomaricurvus sp.]|uniref:hypothetical protein n=1 Tax=Pseudomaricurvus sp. TaxID=2004510 RepID=UPI003F6B919F